MFSFLHRMIHLLIMSWIAAALQPFTKYSWVQSKLKSAPSLSVVPNNKKKDKYSHLRDLEDRTKLPPDTWMVVRVDGHAFSRFVKEHEFVKPMDDRAMKLMNSCAAAVMEEFKEIIFAYGYSDEYSFVFKRSCDMYGRRVSKIQTLTASLFTAKYIMQWKEIFPEKDLMLTPTFDARVVSYKSDLDLMEYMAWRQEDCQRSNRYNTCFWELVKSGKSLRQASRELQGVKAKETIELLSNEFGIEYNTLPASFRKGTCIYKEDEEVLKYTPKGEPVTKIKKKLVIEHCHLGDSFWKEHPGILEDTKVEEGCGPL